MALLVYSGGLDSTVMLYKYAAESRADAAVGINYGQRHIKELEMARWNCSKLNIPFFDVDLSSISGIFGDSSLMSKSSSMPEGSYNEAGMKATVVPNRNMIMIAVAAARAISLGCDSVAYAAHGGDHAIYPDCRPDFVKALAEVLKICDYSPIRLEAPFEVYLLDTPLREQDRAGGELLYERSVVRRHDHGTARLGNLMEQPHDTVRSDGVEIARRLVCQQQTRRIEQSACYRKTLLLAARELVRHLVGLVVKPDKRQHLVYAAAYLSLAPPPRSLHHVIEVKEYVTVIQKLVILKDYTHTAPQIRYVTATQTPQIHSDHTSLALKQRHLGIHGLEQRTLAAAHTADKIYGFACRHRQIDIRENKFAFGACAAARRVVAVIYRYIAKFDHIVASIHNPISILC